MLALLELAPLSYSTFEQTVQLFNSLASTLVLDPEFLQSLEEFMQLKVLDLATFDPKEFTIASDQTIIYPSIWKGSENCIKPCNLAKKIC